MQTQWPSVGSALDPFTMDAAFGGGTNGAGASSGPLASAQPADGVARSWWTCGTPTGANAGFGAYKANGGLFGASSATGGLTSLLGSVLTALQQLVGSLTGGNAYGGSSTFGSDGAGNTIGGTCGAASGGIGCPGGGATAPPSSVAGGPQQQFADVDVSSTGDPHLAVVGTRAATSGAATGTQIDDRFDSMTSHDDLVHSDAVDGGYRVSTAVTQPAANGVTFNQSATVRANDGYDSVTMNRDGSFAVTDDGQTIALAKGTSATLAGGETVSANADGSLTVNAAGTNGGTVATTLRANGQGVDVSTHAHDIALGGDAVTHGAPAASQRSHHHGHGHGHRAPVAAPVTAQAGTAQTAAP